MPEPITPSTLEHLVAIEEIKRIKARYWYTIDTKDWAGLAEVFTFDALFDARFEAAAAQGSYDIELPAAAEGDEGVLSGSQITEFISTSAQDWLTVHHGHAPIIELTGRDTARGVWPFFDILDGGTAAMTGYGHYLEEYRRVEGRWLISRLVLKRLRIDGSHPAFA
jgi:SnoaL-like protein